MKKFTVPAREQVSDPSLDAFYAAGYDDDNLVDLILQVSDKIAMNYLHNLTGIPVDFPLAASIESEMLQL